jgi:hypothetical protein
MAVARCPKCHSTTIEPTTADELTNSYRCKSCDHPFTRPATGIWFTNAVVVVIGLKEEIIRTVGGLFDYAKRLFSDDPNVVFPEARAPLPPRQPPPRHPTPPVHPKRHSRVSPNWLNSHRAAAVNDRGVTYSQQGVFDRGIVYFDHAIELRPGTLRPLTIEDTPII